MTERGLNLPSPCREAGVFPLTTSTPLVRRAVTRSEGGTREAQPRFAFSQRTWEIRVVPRLMRRFGKVPHHNGEGTPSERKALSWLKACHPSMSPPPF